MSTPAVEIRSFAVTIPAGTPQSAPFTESVSFPARIVTEVHWQVPPGPSGLMGWKLTMSGGQAVLPVNDTFIVADARSDTWAVINQPDSGQWEVTGYNTDINPHTVYFDFFLTLTGQAATVTTFASNESLSSPPLVTTPAAIEAPPVVTTPAAITTPVLGSPPASSADSQTPAVSVAG